MHTAIIAPSRGLPPASVVPIPRGSSVRPHNPQRVRIPSDWLEPGLHVVELDRPWHDTPFVVEGFIADRAEELETLKRSCQSVHVDLERSEPSVAAGLLARLNPAIQPDRGATRPPGQGAEVRLSHAARLRLRQLMQFGSGGPVAVDSGWLDRLRGWLLSRSSTAGLTHEDARLRLGAHASRGLLPPEIEAVQHPPAGDFARLAPAAQALLREVRLALRTLLQPPRASDGPCVDIQTLSALAYRLADGVIAHPDTLLWCALVDHSCRSSTPDRGSEQALRTAITLLMLGRHLGLGRRPLAELALTGLLADLGKTSLPAHLLEKPGMLNAEEFRHIQSHVAQGLRRLAACADLPVTVEIAIAQHHERLDGSGYPAGLRGDDISLQGRMAAIADSFSAQISARPHAPSGSAQEAFMRLCDWAGSSFDEPLVEQFIQALTAWPAGTLAELDSGEVAVVMQPARSAGEQTLVQVLLGPDKQTLDYPSLRRMGPATGEAEQTLGRRLVNGLPEGAHGLNLPDWAPRLGLHP